MYCNVYKKICIDTAPQKGKYNSCFNLVKKYKIELFPFENHEIKYASYMYFIF